MLALVLMLVLMVMFDEGVDVEHGARAAPKQWIASALAGLRPRGSRGQVSRVGIVPSENTYRQSKNKGAAEVLECFVESLEAGALRRSLTLQGYANR